MPINTNELLSKHRNAIAYIESQGFSFDIEEALEIGVEALVDKARRQSSVRRHQALQQDIQNRYKNAPQKSLYQVVNEAVKHCQTWQELVVYCESNGHKLDVSQRNAPPIGNHERYYEDLFVQRQTRGKYCVSRRGQILAS